MGLIMEQSDRKALRWYEAAAAQGLSGRDRTPGTVAGQARAAEPCPTQARPRLRPRRWRASSTARCAACVEMVLTGWASLLAVFAVEFLSLLYLGTLGERSWPPWGWGR